MATGITPQQQQAAERHIAMADAVHDLGQSGRVTTEDLPYCRLALGDMMLNRSEPSPNNLDGASAYMNSGLQAITDGAITSTSGSYDAEGQKISYERTYAAVVFPDGFQTISFQQILASYYDWESAGKPGERPLGWLEYIGFRDEESKARAIPELAARGVAETAIAALPVGSTYLRGNPRSSFGSLSVKWDPDDSRYQPYEIYDNKNKGRNLRIICDFITKYLYSDRKTIEKGAFVFDADGGSIKKLFDSLTQISSELNPMVVADSAGTSSKQLGDGPYRNAYCFPYNREGEPVFDTLANVHTHNFSPDPRFSTQFYFVRSNDAAGNPIEYTGPTYRVFTLGFVITNTAGAPFEVQAAFSTNGPKSGPSVPYLGSVIASIRKAYYSYPQDTANMIRAFQEYNPQPTGVAMSVTAQIIQMMTYLAQNGMSTPHICLWVEQFAMDLKKCGDWEQIRSIDASMKTCPDTVGTAMLCTGDFLCSAKARLEGQNGLWHYEGENDVEGWKLHLFRSPDLSDPNMQAAVSIVDKARAALPLLYLSQKPGLSEAYTRLNALTDATRDAVDQMRRKFPPPPPLEVGADTPTLGEFQAQTFADIFATLCLASVCSKALRRKTAIDPLAEIGQQLTTNAAQGGVDTATFISETAAAVSSFQQANTDGQLPAYVARFTPYIEPWSQLSTRFGGSVDTIKSTLVDIGIPAAMVDDIDSNPAVDIDQAVLNDLIFDPAVPIITMNGANVVLNPVWTCGSGFQYDYRWIDTVGATQGLINGASLQALRQIRERIIRQATELQANAWGVGPDGRIPLDVMRTMSASFGSALTTLKQIYTYYSKKARDESKNYVKCVEYSTNLDDPSVSMLAKQSLLATFKIPDRLDSRSDNVRDVMEAKLATMYEVIDNVITLATGSTDAIWIRVLPVMYDMIGLPMAGGARFPEQSGGVPPTPEDEYDVVRTYLTGVISTAIGFCYNSTYQLTYADQQSPQALMAALASYGDLNLASYNSARVAIARGCLINPTTRQLVFGPRVTDSGTLGRALNEPIMTTITQLFHLNIGDAPIYDLAAVRGLTDAQKQTIYSALLNKVYDEGGNEIPDVGLVDVSGLQNVLPLPALRVEDVLLAILFMTAIGAISGPSFRKAAFAAYDTVYISNTNVRLAHPDTVFADGAGVDFNAIAAQIPYFAQSLSRQFVIYSRPGMQLNSAAYCSTQFLRSPLRQVLFQDSAMARWASMGRFKMWTNDELEEDDEEEEEQDAAGATPTEYRRFINEAQFTFDVIDTLRNATVAVVNRNQAQIDELNTKLSFGIANIPNLYYAADDSDTSLVIIERAQVSVDEGLAQAFAYAEASSVPQQLVQQQIQLQASEVVQYNRDMTQLVSAFVEAYRQFYVVPQQIQQTYTQAQTFLNLRTPQEQYQAAPRMVPVAGGAKKKVPNKRRTKRRARRARKTRGREASTHHVKNGTARAMRKPKKTRARR